MSRPLWNCDEIAAATCGKLVGGENWQATGISIDSRALVPGDLFVALNVERDGHDFVENALSAGAVGSLVAKESVAGAKIVVTDPQIALEQLAIAARQRSAATRIAVTGSVGKTSVKDALAVVLTENGPTHKSTQSYNNQWGVPLTLARMPLASKWAVLEVGTNQPGEIASLSGLVRPHVGVITRIGEAHLAGFGTVEAIAREKASLWVALEEAGTAVLPGDGAMTDILLTQANYFGVKNFWKFGWSENCDVRIINWQTGLDGSHGQFDVRGQVVDIFAPVTGMHWAEVLAAVMATSTAIGLRVCDIAASLRNISTPDGRGGVLTLPLSVGSAILIDDSYNANPTSMKAALDTVSRFDAKRKLAVLGEMLELGPEAERMHGELAWSIEQAGIAKVWCVGELMRCLQSRLPKQRQASIPKDIAELANSIYAELQDGDVLLIKGSNGSGVHRVAAGLRQLAQQKGR